MVTKKNKIQNCFIPAPMERNGWRGNRGDDQRQKGGMKHLAVVYFQRFPRAHLLLHLATFKFNLNWPLWQRYPSQEFFLGPLAL